MSDIVQYPAAILKMTSEPAIIGSKQTREVADALRMTLRLNKRQGIGLSAPQIGVGIRIFVLDTRHLRLKCSDVFVNPTITWTGAETDVMDEGCLSFPDAVAVPVRRPTSITVEAFDANGKPFSLELSGLAARCVQHEIDHLDGVTMLSYATPARKKKAMKSIAASLQLKVGKPRATLR